jgi:selenium metabolism protein YedF
MNVIDATGKPCPVPVIEAKKALRQTPAGETVKILVDNDVSRQNLEKMARGLGCPFSFEKQAGGNILVSIVNVSPASPAGGRGGLVVAIGKNVMGRGNDDLGAILIKSFIYSLTEMDVPPEILIFFNSGVKLAVQGSTVTADLEKLESRGTIISSCGTCLDFYGLKEKLAVGNVTNMYAIASAMGEAGKLINI